MKFDLSCHLLPILVIWHFCELTFQFYRNSIDLENIYKLRFTIELK